MKTKILFLFAFFTLTISAQYVLVDFEGVDLTADPVVQDPTYTGTWGVFTDNNGTPVLATAASYEVVANPNSSGINTTAQVGKHRRENGTPNWSGDGYDFLNPNTFDYTASTAIIKMWFYAGVNSIVKLKLVDVNDATTSIELNASYTTANAWQELTWDFTGMSVTVVAGETEDPLDKLALFPYWYGSGADTYAGDFYYDNIIVTDGQTAAVNDFNLVDFSMSPNPTAGMLNIQSKTAIHSATIYDISGREVMHVAKPTSKAINVSNLETGVYLIDFYNENTTRLGVSKFIKK